MSGKYKSIKTGRFEKYDSSYELRRFKALDSSPLVKSWTKKHGLKLKYVLKGKTRSYHPDIFIEYYDGRKYIEEVKGKVWNGLEFGAKNLSAAMYCYRHGMLFRIILREHLESVI